jgi:hypothetical protein
VAHAQTPLLLIGAQQLLLLLLLLLLLKQGRCMVHIVCL